VSKRNRNNITQSPDNENEYIVKCPEQSIKSNPTKKGIKLISKWKSAAIAH